MGVKTTSYSGVLSRHSKGTRIGRSIGGRRGRVGQRRCPRVRRGKSPGGSSCKVGGMRESM